MTVVDSSAAVAVAAETPTSTPTCSKVLYNNARCGQPLASPSVDYCMHHRPDRIPCPVDPRHFVSTKGLEKHIRKCNATKQASALAACPFFLKGVNAGRRGTPTALELAAREEAAKDLSGTKRPRLAPGRKRSAEEMGSEALLELLVRVRSAADEVLPAPAALEAAAAAAAAATAAAAAAAAKPPVAAAARRPASHKKHGSQNDAIVSIALEAGVFGSRAGRSMSANGKGEPRGSPSSSIAVVELGAGRGYLGSAAADALVKIHAERREKAKADEDEAALALPLECSSLTLVDKRAYRNKAERHYRSVVGSGSKDTAAARAAVSAAAAAAERQRPPFRLERATVDLADALLSSLPGVADPSSSPSACDTRPPPKMALLGKHLCGPATDFALRAAVSQLRLSSPNEEVEGGKGKTHSLSGLAVATCCHHACCWSDFCGKAEFLSLGFTADEFEIVSQASAWATGGHGRPGKGEKEETDGEKSQSGDEDDNDRGGGSGQEEEEAANRGGAEKKEGSADGLDPSPPPNRCWQSRIPIADRRAAGDAAKRLLDGCRVRWLERHSSSFSSRSSSSPSPSSSPLLVVQARAYAPEGVTGENRLIVAVPRRLRG